MRNTVLAAEKHPPRVDCLHAVPRLGLGGEDGIIVGRHDARVVVEDVNAAIAFGALRIERSHAFGVAHVDFDERRLATRCSSPLACLATDIGHDHRSTLSGKEDRGLAPDTAAGPGDDRYLAIEAFHFCQPSVVMKTFLTSEYPSSAFMPSSRPKPDCLKPPNGVETRTDELLLMDSTPVSSARATRSARAPLVVQIDPDNP